MDILIIGAGPGGLAAACALSKRGHQVKVLERLEDPTIGGAAVTIFSNGALALKGCEVELQGLGGRIDDLVLLRADGRRLLHFDLRAMTNRFGHPVRTIPRSDLLNRLRDRLPDGVVRCAVGVESLRVNGGDVEAVLASGELLRPQVVVGADGHRSVVRRDILDPTPARPSGWGTWQGLSPILPELASGNEGRMIVGDAGLVGLMPAGSGLVQWWFDVPWSGKDRQPNDPVRWLGDHFSGYAEPVGALLASICDQAIAFFPHVTHDVRDRWGSGPATLVGDAAHVFPPSQAQGANQAFEDAWILSQALAQEADLEDCLRRYERCRARRVRLVSRMAASERTNRAPGALLGALARATPPRTAGYLYARLIRRFSSVLNGEEP